MRPVQRKRAFSLGLAGLFKVPLSCLLPGASTYWDVGARRLARRRLAAGGTGVVVSCRMPSVGQRGRDVVGGWDDVEVVVNDAAVARFWSVFRKSARWLELPAGLVRVRVEGGGRLPLPRLEFGLSEGEVVIVEVVPAMRTGPRRIDAPRVTVFGSTNRELPAGSQGHRSAVRCAHARSGEPSFCAARSVSPTGTFGTRHIGGRVNVMGRFSLADRNTYGLVPLIEDAQVCSYDRSLASGERE